MSEQTSTVTYDLPVNVLDEAVSKIEKANARLYKNNLPLFGYTTETYTKETNPNGVVLFEKRVRVILDTPSICFAGWTFLARVDRIAEDSYVVASVPGVELNGYKPESWECDHCHTKRNRKSQYIITDGNTRMLVGGSCLELFLGVKPEGLWTIGWDELSELEHDSVSRFVSEYSVDQILAIAKVLVDQFGYRGKFTNDPTSENVRAVLMPNDKEYQWAADIREKATDINVADLKEQILNSLTGTSDWAENVRVLMSQKSVEWRYIAVLASSLCVIAKAKQEKIADTFVDSYYLNPKDKFETTATVTHVSYGESNYGYYPTTMTYVTFRTDDGHRLFWASSANIDPEEGQVVTLTGTVKSHDIYRDAKSTKVTRCKMSVK